jgi:hypothetical protein
MSRLGPGGSLLPPANDLPPDPREQFEFPPALLMGTDA